MSPLGFCGRMKDARRNKFFERRAQRICSVHENMKKKVAMFPGQGSVYVGRINQMVNGK